MSKRRVLGQSFGQSWGPGFGRRGAWQDEGSVDQQAANMQAATGRVPCRGMGAVYPKRNRMLTKSRKWSRVIASSDEPLRATYAHSGPQVSGGPPFAIPASGVIRAWDLFRDPALIGNYAAEYCHSEIARA